MKLSKQILDYINCQKQEALELLIELAQIPAPSNHEEQRAAFCKQWLEEQGAEGVYLDDALNVIYPVNCTEENPVMVFMAHSDVVFPDMESLPLTVKNGKIYCPGVGDDTANAVALLMAAKYIAEHHITPQGKGVLLVINSGEEGLGNLKGCRKIMEDFGSRIEEFVSFDGKNAKAVNKAVGSKRYQIEIRTEGGHSYNDFGNRNAISCMASLINDLYTVKVPEKGKTTYNVGLIQGGTSVNTIAQHAQMLYEFRSDERESMEIMQQQLNAVIDDYRGKGMDITVTLVGHRPCSGEVDTVKEENLMSRAAEATLKYYGQELVFGPGSTDCNIPLSIGIPSVCLGCYFGEGSHTREEYVEIESLYPGLCVAFDLILYHF